MSPIAQDHSDFPTAVPDSYSEGGVPVFKPTYDQFKDFYQYVKLINQYGMRSGIAKVVPPQEWLAALPAITKDKIQSVKIRNPIVQNINGAKGVYISENMERHRTYNLAEWKQMAQMQNHQPPVPRGQKRKQLLSKTAKTTISKATSSKSTTNNQSENNHSDSNSQRKKSLEKEAMFDNFDYDIDTSGYTPERCEFLEHNYWKTLSYAQPMYGADCLGSIFDDSVPSWNVAKLPNLLDHLNQQIPGVNEAYLYAGLWKASFAWHLEDQDLYSINYLHFGAPKQWYSIPQSEAQNFYNLMVDLFPENYKACTEFLRHKTFMCSPAYLQAKGIKVNKIVHYKNEFIITFPYGYHSGFNYDYNLAESVNFALEEWLEVGLRAKKCECVSHSVGIDVVDLIKNIKKHRPDLLEEHKSYGVFTNEEEKVDENSGDVDPDEESNGVKKEQEQFNKDVISLGSSPSAILLQDAFEPDKSTAITAAVTAAVPANAIQPKEMKPTLTSTLITVPAKPLRKKGRPRKNSLSTPIPAPLPDSTPSAVATTSGAPSAPPRGISVTIVTESKANENSQIVENNTSIPTGKGPPAQANGIETLPQNDKQILLQNGTAQLPLTSASTSLLSDSTLPTSATLTNPHSIPASTISSSTTTIATAPADQQAQQPKRKRGRPRKYPLPISSSAISSPSAPKPVPKPTKPAKRTTLDPSNKRRTRRQSALEEEAKERTKRPKGELVS